VSNPWVTIITEDNEVYANNIIIPDVDEDFKLDIYKFLPTSFNGGQVLDIGGQYTNRYAIVKN